MSDVAAFAKTRIAKSPRSGERSYNSLLNSGKVLKAYPKTSA
jgi:hypothetical protein